VPWVLWVAVSVVLQSDWTEVLAVQVWCAQSPDPSLPLPLRMWLHETNVCMYTLEGICWAGALWSHGAAVVANPVVGQLSIVSNWLPYLVELVWCHFLSLPLQAIFILTYSLNRAKTALLATHLYRWVQWVMRRILKIGLLHYYAPTSYTERNIMNWFNQGCVR